MDGILIHRARYIYININIFEGIYLNLGKYIAEINVSVRAWIRVPGSERLKLWLFFCDGAGMGWGWNGSVLVGCRLVDSFFRATSLGSLKSRVNCECQAFRGWYLNSVCTGTCELSLFEGVTGVLLFLPRNLLTFVSGFYGIAIREHFFFNFVGLLVLILLRILHKTQISHQFC